MAPALLKRFLTPSAPASSHRHPLTAPSPSRPSTSRGCDVAFSQRRSRTLAPPAHPRRLSTRIFAEAGGPVGFEEDGAIRRSPLESTCRLMTRAFLEACMSQPGTDYVTSLRSFVNTAKEAYVGGVSVGAITLQWQMTPDTGSPVLDEFLRQRQGLQDAEVELRRSWLSTCYLAFAEAGLLPEGGKEPPMTGADQTRLGIFVQNVTELARRGYDAQRIKLEEALAMSDNAQPRSEPESAAFSQAIRIVFLALEGCGTLNHQGEPISSSPAPAPYGENGGSPGSEGPPGNVRRGPGEAAISEDNAVPSNGKDEAEIRQEHGKLRVRLLKEKAAQMGVDVSDCFDKESLVDKLTLALLRSGGAAPLFAGLRVDNSEYAGVALSFPSHGTLFFHVDTAASHNIITPQVADKIKASATGASTTSEGATGFIGVSHEVTLGAASLGGVELRGADFRAAVMQAPVGEGTAGIIGLSFLNAFEAVEFRWLQRPGEALFHPKGTVGWEALTERLCTVPLERIGRGLLCTRVCVGDGEPILALVDTGAPFTIANAAAGVKVDSRLPEMKVSGADGQLTALGVSEGRPEIRLPGGTVLGSAALLVGDMQGFDLFAGANQPALILGLDILSQRPRLVFSSATQRMAI